MNAQTKDNFESSVNYLVEVWSDASDLKDLLFEKLHDVMEYGFEGVDDAIAESTSNEHEENILHSYSKDIVGEACSRVLEQFILTRKTH